MVEGKCCANCGTSRLPLHAKGFCKRCYRIRRRIFQLERWNPTDPSSLKGYPSSMPLTQNPEYVRNMQVSAIGQLRKQLADLRTREQLLDSPIDSTRIEYQLQRLAEKAGARNAYGTTHGLATVFDDFGPEHRSTLYRVLNGIEENIPRRGIRWTWFRGDSRQRFSLSGRPRLRKVLF